MAKSQNGSDGEGKTEEKTSAKTHSRHPLRKRRSIKFLKIAGLFVGCFCLYVIWFMCGRPTIDTDYVSKLNQIYRPEDYRQEDNAWPYYKKAMELYVEPNAGDEYGVIFSRSHEKFFDFNDAEQKLIIGWVERNEAAWQEFIAASLKPYCYIEYKLLEMDEESRPKLDVPTWKINGRHISDLRKLSKLGAQRINVEIESENIEPALDDCFTLLNAATQWYPDKLLMETLCGFGFSRLGCEGLLKIISGKDLEANRLKNIQGRLSNIYESKCPTIDFEYERILFLDTVQHTFTKGGLGGGHLIPRYVPPLVQSFSVIITLGELETEPTLKERVLYAAISILHARRNKTVSRFNEVCEKIETIKDMTPYERRKADGSIDVKQLNIFNYKIYFDSFIKESRYFLVEVLTPAAERLADIIYENKAEYEATITVLALERYKAVNGNYPEILEELLKDGYIQKLPMDPYSDKPIVYKKTDTDFTLYSVGRNFKDDGGKLAFYSPGEVIKWGEPTEEGGDAVFWPVQ